MMIQGVCFPNRCSSTPPNRRLESCAGVELNAPSDPFCDIDMACLEKFIEFAGDPKYVLTGDAAAPLADDEEVLKAYKLLRKLRKKVCRAF